MSFWGAHEFRRNPKNRPPKKIPHEDCTAGIKVLGGFSVMWITKLLISLVKKDFLPQNDQIWPKIGIFGQFGPGHAGLFNTLLWVVWWLWRAGCISQDTYLLYLALQDS